jgi:2-aminoadipate transaminase
MVNIEKLFSDRVGKMRKSEIRELLSVTQDPEIISFAGGLPNPKAFPVDDIRSIVQSVLKDHGKNALQYGSTEGLPALRETIADRMCKEGINATKDNIIITSGSQQALDIVGKMFIDPGDVVLIGIPSYLGAINAFRSYEANLVGVPLDKDGLRVDLLEDKIKELKKDDFPLKFIYTVPTFHNPAGTVMPESRRRKLVDIAYEYDLAIIEDDPYSKLIYDGDRVKTVKSFDDDGHVVYLSTFSKILAPGFRLAWIVGSEDLIRKIAICKQALDLCTNPFTQYIANEFIRCGSLDLHIMKICELYKPKRDIMMRMMDEYFPDGCSCTYPKGGMFAWPCLPEGIDTEKMFIEAIKKKVAYVHGKAFCIDGSGERYMRLNFSYSTNEQIEEGMKRLGEVIEKQLKVIC